MQPTYALSWKHYLIIMKLMASLDLNQPMNVNLSPAILAMIHSQRSMDTINQGKISQSVCIA